jgi:hypothetical protein
MRLPLTINFCLGALLIATTVLFFVTALDGANAEPALGPADGSGCFRPVRHNREIFVNIVPCDGDYTVLNFQSIENSKDFHILLDGNACLKAENTRVEPSECQFGTAWRAERVPFSDNYTIHVDQQDNACLSYDGASGSVFLTDCSDAQVWKIKTH